MDNYEGSDVTLYLDFDGQIEMFILANNGEYFIKIIDKAIIPKKIDFNLASNEDHLDQLLNF